MKIVHKTFNVHKTFSKHIQEGKSWVIKRARSYMNISLVYISIYFIISIYITWVDDILLSAKINPKK